MRVAIPLTAMTRAWIYLVVLGGGVPAWGGPVSFSSGPSHVALIELYTSEGCSSCPPAERWLGALRDDPRLWKEFVPVAFHVNYWDYIGWKDRFAAKLFTDRQYAIAHGWRSSQVYTPCFVRDGMEWRSRDLATHELRDAGELVVERSADAHVTVAFNPASTLAGNSFDAFCALLGGSVISDVRAGENAGRKLAHEFVALRLASVPLAFERGQWRAELPLPIEQDEGIRRHALAVWITRRGELASVQAAGGWLD